MSVLSRQQVLTRIASSELVITPIIDAGIQFGKSTIDLRIGTMASIVRGSGLSHVDPKAYISTGNPEDYVLERGRRRKLEHVSVPFGHPLTLHAGSLILVPTLEWVKLPKDLTGVVTARSSWAREGLSIATATFINPCYNGIITLELANLGHVPVVLYPGMRIAQLAIYEIDLNAADDCDDASRSQFDLSFESGAGDITKGDLSFIPR
jgi:dCTP deaminase